MVIRYMYSRTKRPFETMIHVLVLRGWLTPEERGQRHQSTEEREGLAAGTCPEPERQRDVTVYCYVLVKKPAARRNHRFYSMMIDVAVHTRSSLAVDSMYVYRTSGLHAHTACV